MDKTINDFSTSLLLWQIVVAVVIAVMIYYIVKLYKKVDKYLSDKKED